ncbi:MAG: hypothetical protein HYU66_05310 [Armatimonadetes bacterium]|nr:hypothetical protein [Armatimonadota bacterium]
MSGVLLNRLAVVLAAGGVSLIASLLCGIAVVPCFRRLGFVSRESKKGVAHARRDEVAMGGGFILLLGVTLTILAFTAFEQIRRGYALCFLIVFWGFGLLGFLDDRSKVLAKGYAARWKAVLQLSVAILFVVCFQLYVSRFVRDAELAGGPSRVAMGDLGVITLPFVGNVPLGVLYLPFIIAYLFAVSNAVNVTDGFNGLAGGTGAMTALAYAVVSFLIGVYEQNTSGDTGIGRRMFALSAMSSAVAGSCIAYLYFNFHRGCIYFGDTGSMALGAALAFLALFSRTEFLFCVIGGVFFVEAGSVFLQQLSVALDKLKDKALVPANEPARPFLVAPLHHHFEHLKMRELGDRAELRAEVRRCITIRAWRLAAVFAVFGVAAQYGLYRSWPALYDWSCVAGVLLGAAILAYAVYTRFRYDCYFLGPDREDPTLLSLYRGVPWTFFGRRLYEVYERSGIPLSRLGYLEQRIGLLRLLFSRIDARTWFGLVHFEYAERGDPGTCREHYQLALSFWERVPREPFLVAGREDVLQHMAACYHDAGRYAKAVESLETLVRHLDGQAPARDLARRVDAIQAEALSRAEGAYAEFASDHDCDDCRQRALAAHEELQGVFRLILQRCERVRKSLDGRLDAVPDERAALDSQITRVRAALEVAEDRCRRLQPAPAGGAA